MFNDEKIKLIRTLPEGDKIVIIWVQLLCLAGKTNDGGSVYMGQNICYTDEMLATLFDQPLNVMRVAIKTLEQFEMIESYDNGVISIINWDKHQNTDGMEKIKIQNRERKKRFDLKKKAEKLGLEPKQLPNDINKLEEIVSNVTVTFGNATEEEEEEEEEKNRRESSKSKPKKPPRKKYGEYQHILLTEAQHAKLIKDYSVSQVEDVIKKMDEWIQLKGKPYKDFNLALRKWIREESTKGAVSGQVTGYDFSDELI